MPHLPKSSQTGPDPPSCDTGDSTSNKHVAVGTPSTGKVKMLSPESHCITRCDTHCERTPRRFSPKACLCLECNVRTSTTTSKFLDVTQNPAAKPIRGRLMGSPPVTDVVFTMGIALLFSQNVLDFTLNRLNSRITFNATGTSFAFFCRYICSSIGNKCCNSFFSVRVWVGYRNRQVRSLRVILGAPLSWHASLTEGWCYGKNVSAFWRCKQLSCKPPTIAASDAGPGKISVHA